MRNKEKFPKTLTAETLRGWVTTEHGCTHPRVGEIDGCRYIAKCGIWSTYSSDGHVLNELAADAFLRAAGLNVPASKAYRVDFGGQDGEHVVRLAVFKADTVPLGEAWEKADATGRARIRAQVLAAYPIQALIAGIDTFTTDNVRVDTEGNLWFVDNGASFDYRACGLKKGWFWQRGRIDDPKTGYLSLARHRDQGLLRRLLGGVDPMVLWKAAADADLVRLTRALPGDLARPEWDAYLTELADFAARTVANPPPTRTEAVFVLDRSGSMYKVVNDVIGGFNRLLVKQKQETGVCRVSTVLFDDTVQVLHNRIPIRDVEPISEREYVIGGCTALLDALGGAVTHHIEVQRRLPASEKADKVVFAVITDGFENASKLFSPDQVRKLITRQTEEWGWEFLFLGANIDAVATAKAIGIDADHAVDFVCDDVGVGAGYDAVDQAVSNVRNRRRVEDPDERGASWRTNIDQDYNTRKAGRR